jgi:hypothetical protein
MQITIKNTSKIVQLNGIPARVWEGKTSSGIKVTAFISRITISKDESAEVINQFETELKQQSAPSVEVEAIPLRLIL